MVGAHLKPFELRNLAELGTGQDLKVAGKWGLDKLARRSRVYVRWSNLDSNVYGGYGLWI